MRQRRFAENGERRAHGKGDVHGVLAHDLGLVAPDVLEEVLHDEPRLVPDELVVALQHVSATDACVRGGHTSEKAGAAILR